jgi:large conductance mechanosensitive channel
MLKELKEFAIKGSMVDMAVGIIIGGAFGTVVTSLVNDVLMPVVSSVTGAPDFSNLFVVLSNPNNVEAASVAAAREGGASVLAVGLFINAVMAFLLMAMALFFVVKGINSLRRAEAAAPPPAPPEPPAQEKLLAEIRDLLQRQVRA